MMWKVATFALLSVVGVMTGYLTMMATLLFWEGKPRGDETNYGLLSIAVGILGFSGPGVAFWFFHERRFSLRALFLVTTVIAVVLGIVAWWIP